MRARCCKLYNAYSKSCSIVVIVSYHLGDGREAVGGARSVGHHVHVRGVLFLVHSHHEHGSVSRRSADHNLSCVHVWVISSLNKCSVCKQIAPSVKSKRMFRQLTNVPSKQKTVPSVEAMFRQVINIPPEV